MLLPAALGGNARRRGAVRPAAHARRARRRAGRGARARRAADGGAHRAQRHDGLGDGGAGRRRLGGGGPRAARRRAPGTWWPPARCSASPSRSSSSRRCSPALPLAALWWWGAGGTRGAARAGAAGGAARRASAVGLAWLVAVTVLVPAGQRPWAFGSTNGSAWNSVFVYDGWDRLTRRGARPRRQRAGAPARRPGPAAAAVGARAPRRARGLRAGRRAAGARRRRRRGRLDGGWTARAAPAWPRWRSGWRSARCSSASQRDLRPRYLEALDPAVAACAGLGRRPAARRAARAGRCAAARWPWPARWRSSRPS